MLQVENETYSVDAMEFILFLFECFHLVTKELSRLMCLLLILVEKIFIN